MADKTNSPADIMNLDANQFGALIEPYRRELQAHCYRMMGSVQDAEEMVQDTFLKAWRFRESYEGRASLKAWLYRIATNTCLDSLKKHPRRCVPITHQAISNASDPIPPPVMEAIWLEPYPDYLLVEDTDNPEALLVSRETISLAFIVALHLLPARQRAVLILRDVLEWQANEVAELLDTSVSAVKSALHRARSTLAEADLNKTLVNEIDSITQEHLDEYIQAWYQADIPTLLNLLTEDATFSMPPLPSWYQGHESIAGLVAKTVFSGEAHARWRLLPTRANHQLAFGLYRLNEADGTYSGYGIQVMTCKNGLISDLTTFRNPALMPYFQLPQKLESP